MLRSAQLFAPPAALMHISRQESLRTWMRLLLADLIYTHLDASSIIL
jgi:hypothetical protein